MPNYTDDEELHRDQVPVISTIEMNPNIKIVRGLGIMGQPEDGLYLGGVRANSDSTNY